MLRLGTLNFQFWNVCYIILYTFCVFELCHNFKKQVVEDRNKNIFFKKF